MGAGRRQSTSPSASPRGVKLAAHAKKTVKLTLDKAGTKYLATNSHLAIMSLVATPKGGARFAVDVVFLSR